MNSAPNERPAALALLAAALASLPARRSAAASGAPAAPPRPGPVVKHLCRLRAASSHPCRISTAAAWSTTARRRPPGRHVRTAYGLRPRSTSSRRPAAPAPARPPARAAAHTPARGPPRDFPCPRGSPGARPRPPHSRGLNEAHELGDILAARCSLSGFRSRRSVTSGVARIPSGSHYRHPDPDRADVDAQPDPADPVDLRCTTLRHGALWFGSRCRGDQLLDRGQQRRRLVGRHAAALGQVGVAAAPAGQRALDQVAGVETTVPGGRVDRHDQRRLAAGPGRHRDHRRPAGRSGRGSPGPACARRCPPRPRAPRPRPARRRRTSCGRVGQRARRWPAPAGRAASPAPSPRRAAGRRSARPGRRPAPA